MTTVKNVYIEDFQDYNYRRVIFNAALISRRILEERLKQDYVNHLNRLDDVYFNNERFFIIENSDLIDMKLSEVCEYIKEENYTVATLNYDGNGMYIMV